MGTKPVPFGTTRLSPLLVGITQSSAASFKMNETWGVEVLSSILGETLPVTYGWVEPQRLQNNRNNSSKVRNILICLWVL